VRWKPVAILAFVAPALLARDIAGQTAPAPPGAFYGRLISASDSSTISRAEIRLLRIDSTRKAKSQFGLDSAEVFVDSGRTRVGTTDHSGEFAIRGINAGRYLMQIRRLGFLPLQGVTLVDSGIVRAVFAMQPSSRLLAGMTITETAVDKARLKLGDVGFTGRSHFSGGQFLDRQRILERGAATVGELLRLYGVADGDFVLDRLPIRYYDIESYPVDLVIGIEIYHLSRPTEFVGRQRGSALYPEGSRIGALAPLVLIWTYSP
jgi:hypothetical protein